MRKFLTTVAGGVLVLAGVGCAADDTVTDPSGVETDSGNDENPPPADLNGDLVCGANTVGAVASGTLTNHSSGLSGYMISVSFLAGDTRVADATAFVNNVQPDQTSTWEAQAFGTAEYTRCEVISVERMAQ